MSKIKYEIIFEERSVFDEEHNELYLPYSAGFLDIHYYEYDDDEESVYDQYIEKGFDNIFENALVLSLGNKYLTEAEQKLYYQSPEPDLKILGKRYVIVTGVPEVFVDHSETLDFDEIRSFEEKDYDKALDFIKSLNTISFLEAKEQGLWADDEDE